MAIGLLVWIAIGALYCSISEIVSSAISWVFLIFGDLRHKFQAQKVSSSGHHLHSKGDNTYSKGLD